MMTIIIAVAVAPIIITKIEIVAVIIPGIPTILRFLSIKEHD
jgi:hypothetical protein